MDLICITTTISKNEISIKRRNNIVKKFSTFNIPVILNHGLVKQSVNHDVSSAIITNSLNIFMKTTYKYAIICDDDFDPIDTFLEDLKKTIDLLPSDWRCLHLCPGYLWGRKYRDKSKIGHLNPEYPMKDIPFDPSGRFYFANKHVYTRRKFWVGGPVAFVVNNASSLLTDFTNKYKECPRAADVLLTQILNEHDYICREPLLGHEDEQGGSTLKLRG